MRHLLLSAMGLAVGVAPFVPTASAAEIGFYQFEDSPGFLAGSGGTPALTASASSPTQVASPFGSIANLPAGAVPNAEAASFTASDNQSFAIPDASYSSITAEAYIRPDSFGSGSTARGIVSHGGSTSTVAFALSITGTGSGLGARRLFVQTSANGSTLLNSVSPYALTADSNYYVAAVIQPGVAGSGADGSVTFYLQDLTAGTPLQTATVAATGLSAFFDPAAGFRIGANLGSGSQSPFDGIIDEVRISDTALTQSQLLIPEPATLGLIAPALAGLLIRRPRRR